MITEFIYKNLKSKSLDELTTDERKQINEYEQSHLSIPSKSELINAQDIFNKVSYGTPFEKARYSSKGDDGLSEYDKALTTIKRHKLLTDKGNVKFPLSYDVEYRPNQKPSNEEVKNAQDIFNKVSYGSPFEKARYSSKGDDGLSEYDKAIETIKANNFYKEYADKGVLYGDFKTPEDIDNEFHFNWKKAYERNTGEELVRDIKSAKKLEEYINTHINNFDDVDIRRTAIEMGLWNPKVNKWEDFLKTYQGKQISQAFTKDVENNKKQKRLDEIWSGEEKSGGALLADMPGSQFMVDFATPVTKEYARKNYNDINGLSDVGLPLAFDVGSNLVMSGKAAKIFSNPMARNAVNMAGAPLLTETGNYTLNDKSLADASVDMGIGALVNLRTPKVVKEAMNNNKTMVTEAGLEGKKIDSKKLNQQRLQNRVDSHVDEIIERRGKNNDLELIQNGVMNWKTGKINAPEDVVRMDDAIKPGLEYGKMIRDTKWSTPKKSIKEVFAKKPSITKDTRVGLNNNLNISDLAKKYGKYWVEKASMEELIDSGAFYVLKNKGNESIRHYLSRNSGGLFGDYIINSSGRPAIGGNVVSSFSTTFPILPKYGENDKRSEEDKLIEKYFGKKK